MYQILKKKNKLKNCCEMLQRTCMKTKKKKQKKKKKEKAIVAKPLEILSHSLSRKVNSATVNKKNQES